MGQIPELPCYACPSAPLRGVVPWPSNSEAFGIYTNLASGFTADIGGFEVAWELLTSEFSSSEKLFLLRKLGMVHASMLKRERDRRN